MEPGLGSTGSAALAEEPVGDRDSVRESSEES